MSNSSGFNPDPSDLLVMQGLSLLNKELLEEAESIFLQVLSKDPDHAGANAFLSEIEMKRSNIDKALVFIDRAIDVFPAAAYLMTRAEIKLQFGKRKDAVEDLKNCIKNDKNVQFTEKASRILAIISIEEGNYSGGLQYLNDVINLNPKNISALRARSLCRSRLGDRKGAEADVELAKEYDSGLRYFLSELFSPEEISKAPISPNSINCPQKNTISWAASAFLDSKARLHLAHIDHSEQAVAFAFTIVTADAREIYPALVTALKIAPGEVLDLREVDDIDMHNFAFAVFDYESKESMLAETSEIRYLLNGEIKTAVIHNRSVEAHKARLEAYIIDHSYKISRSEPFLEALYKDLDRMSDDGKKRLSLYTAKRLLVEKDIMAAAYAINNTPKDISEESRLIRDHFKMVNKLMELV